MYAYMYVHIYVYIVIVLPAESNPDLQSMKQNRDTGLFSVSEFMYMDQNMISATVWVN
jgi:hypothetical protein